MLFVDFYAPWCGHCKQLEPEFEKAAAALQGQVHFAQVDATLEVALAEQYRVEGYPTLYFFKDGHPEEYNGNRQNDSIVQWLQEHMGPALNVAASEADLEKFLKQRTCTAYFVARGDPTMQDLFNRVAEQNRGLGVFIFMANISQASVHVHRGIDEVVEMALEEDALADRAQVVQFIREQMLPLFGEINQDNYEAYMTHATQGMLWICFNPETFRLDALAFMAVFREVAMAFEQFPVVYVDTKAYEEHVREELGCTAFPAAVLQLGNFSADEEPRRYRTALQAENITAQALRVWLVEAMAGRLEEDDGLDAVEDTGTDAEDIDGEDPGNFDEEHDEYLLEPASAGRNPSEEL